MNPSNHIDELPEPLKTLLRSGGRDGGVPAATWLPRDAQDSGTGWFLAGLLFGGGGAAATVAIPFEDLHSGLHQTAAVVAVFGIFALAMGVVSAVRGSAAKLKPGALIAPWCIAHVREAGNRVEIVPYASVVKAEYSPIAKALWIRTQTQTIALPMTNKALGDGVVATIESRRVAAEPLAIPAPSTSEQERTPTARLAAYTGLPLGLAFVAIAWALNLRAVESRKFHAAQMMNTENGWTDYGGWSSASADHGGIPAQILKLVTPLAAHRAEADRRSEELDRLATEQQASTAAQQERDREARLGTTDDIRELQRYLHDHPDTPHTAEIHARIELLRTRNDESYATRAAANGVDAATIAIVRELVRAARAGTARVAISTENYGEIDRATAPSNRGTAMERNEATDGIGRHQENMREDLGTIFGQAFGEDLAFIGVSASADLRATPSIVVRQRFSVVNTIDIRITTSRVDPVTHAQLRDVSYTTPAPILAGTATIELQVPPTTANGQPASISVGASGTPQIHSGSVDPDTTAAVIEDRAFRLLRNQWLVPLMERLGFRART